MFASRLRQRREKLGLTQTDLGERVGRTKQQIHRYESGEAEPNVTMLHSLAVALSCTADYLVGMVDDPNGRINESDLPPDEQEALAAYRAHKTGDSQQMITLLAKNPPHTS